MEVAPISSFESVRQWRLFNLMRRCRPQSRRWLRLRTALIETVLDKARVVALRYMWADQDDLQQSAAIGIIAAVENYDRFDVAFGAFVYMKALNEAWSALRKMYPRRDVENISLNEEGEIEFAESKRFAVEGNQRLVDIRDVVEFATRGMNARAAAALRAVHVDGELRRDVEPQYCCAVKFMRKRMGVVAPTRPKRERSLVSINTNGGRLRLRWRDPSTGALMRQSIGTCDQTIAESRRIEKEAELRRAA